MLSTEKELCRKKQKGKPQLSIPIGKEEQGGDETKLFVVIQAGNK